MNTKIAISLLIGIILIGAGTYYVTTKLGPVQPSIQDVATTTPPKETATQAKRTSPAATIPPGDGWVNGQNYITANTAKVPQSSLYIKNGLVYCDDKVLTPAADIASLEIKIIKSYLYLRDNRSVWSFGNGCKQVADADPATFSFVLDGKGYIAFTKDKSHVWVSDSVVIPGADSPTFTYMTHSELRGGALYEALFAKDKNRVYTIEKCSNPGKCAPVTITTIANADPATFVFLPTINGGESGYEADKDSIYYFNQQMSGADRSTFAVVATYNKVSASISPVNGIDAQDKNHTYLYGEVVH